MVDNEPMALELLEYELMRFDDINVVGCFTDPLVALKEATGLLPDVVFLDIEMGERNGLEIGVQIVSALHDVEIVFVTAFSHYAVQAFEINAIDYLLKPVSGKRLHKTVTKIRKKLINDHEKVGFEAVKEIKVRCFGNFQVVDSLGEPVHWRTRKTKELFAYLWVQRGRCVHKTNIIEDVFSEKDFGQANALLNTTVYQLRNGLKKLGFPYGVVYRNESYCLNIPTKSDLDEFYCLLTIKKLDDDGLKRLLRFYQQDFIVEGYYWTVEARSKYKNLALGALENNVSSRIEEKVFSPMLKDCLWKMYKIDPSEEGTANLMIRYLGEMRKKIDLKFFYRDYTRVLKEELGLEPSNCIRKLYDTYMQKL